MVCAGFTSLARTSRLRRRAVASCVAVVSEMAMLIGESLSMDGMSLVSLMRLNKGVLQGRFLRAQEIKIGERV
jgi:hypothetical protein